MLIVFYLIICINLSYQNTNKNADKSYFNWAFRKLNILQK